MSKESKVKLGKQASRRYSRAKTATRRAIAPAAENDTTSYHHNSQAHLEPVTSTLPDRISETAIPRKD
jgi:hypothetical protein